MNKLRRYKDKLNKIGFKKFIKLAYAKKFRTSYPTMISVEIMTKCNLKCKHCRVTYHGNLIQDVTPGFMDFSQFTKIIDRVSPLIKRAFLFRLSTIEPLFHKDIFKMMDYVAAYNRDIEFEILTNGMLLNEKNISELLKRNVPEITVSLDGCKAETVESFKTNTVFKKVVDNIMLLNKMCEDKITLNVVFVSTRDNIDELVDYVGFCKSLGVNRIFINGFLSFLPENSYLYLYSKQGNHEVQEIFQNAYEEAKRVSIDIEVPSLKAEPQGCGYTSIMTIDENGNVAPCIMLARKTPFELFSKSSVVEPFIFGNIFETEPYSIWNGKKSLEFRNLLKSNRIPRQCLLCADAYGVICSNRNIKPIDN